VLETGEIIAAITEEASVLVFSPDGSPRLRIGRKGLGPGEFSGGWLTVFPAATEVFGVYDQDVRRITLFHRTGQLVRQVSVPPGAAPSRPLWVAGAVAGASPVLLLLAGTDTVDRPMYRRLFDVLVVDTAGIASQKVARVPGRNELPPTMVQEVVDGLPTNVRRTLYPAAASYPLPVAATRDRIFALREDSLLSVLGVDGAELYRVLLPDRPPQFRTDKRNRFRSSESVALGLVTDVVGNVWVEQPRLRALDASLWLVVSPEGRVLGRVQLPAERRLLAAGRSAVMLGRFDPNRLMFLEVRSLTVPW
jgi:hypothetical protein